MPFLGICLGMQLAVIEFCRNVLNFKNAHSTEFDSNNNFPIIALISDGLMIRVKYMKEVLIALWVLQ